MRVIHHTAKYLPPSQTFIFDLTEYLDKRLDESLIVTHGLMGNADKTNIPIKQVSLTGLPVWRRKIQNYISKLRGRAPNLHFGHWLKTISERKPDVVHCHFGNSAYFHQKFLDAHNLSIPTLVSFHGYDVFLANKIAPDYITTIQTLAKAKTLFTCPSNYLARHAIKVFSLPESQVRVVPNGFNPELFQLRTNKALDSNQIVITHVGRFENWKGQEDLIRAISELDKVGVSNVYLQLIGDGEAFNSMKNLAQELQISDRVRFLGLVSHQKVASTLRKTDLYVHPSSTGKNGQAETFGVAILEAIAIGLPVIMTNAGGMKEIIPSPHPQFAQVVQEKSPKALAESIQQWLHHQEDYSEQDFMAFRDTVLGLNNMERTGQLIQKLYNEVSQ
ncbi:glycosyltransferase family 4 protein [Echinimonas agarilytica]|uniref:Glycosyltransferase family 4 protein n=1 Tax=Echinimonas agarilytica TaxID=1215918 RepID=A0AA41WBL8_9GAMM|nr:glycosyltransferase family 4 protein [Echinimonas agarilytica]MCM2681482.1 glycosyltransferase family 4 protein [Echinimonas agarilytica]